MSLLSLIAMVFWGMVLSFGYQLFLPLAERQRSVMASVLFYGGAGVVCFLSTALFLYAVSGGAWGIYGFFALLLGFWLYYSFFRIWGRRFAMAVGYALGGTLRGGMRFGRKAADGATLPFGKIVDKGVAWTEKRRKEKENDQGDML